MGLKEDIRAFEQRLDRAINNALEGDVADAAKTFLSQAVEDEVYARYSPRVYDRRGATGGGLADVRTMQAVLEGDSHTLNVWAAATGVDDAAGVEIRDIVAAGTPFTYFENDEHPAGGRPFHEAAERNFAQSGVFESTLEQSLGAQGFAVIRG